MNPTVTCACGAVAEPFEEEVDIGVGIQRFLTGWQCPDHGGICGVCYGCGTAEKIGYTHELWCKEHPGVTITAESFEAETDKIVEKVVDRFGWHGLRVVRRAVKDVGMTVKSMRADDDELRCGELQEGGR